MLVYMPVCIYTSLQQGVIWHEEELSKEEIDLHRESMLTFQREEESVGDSQSRDGQDIWTAKPVIEEQTPSYIVLSVLTLLGVRSFIKVCHTEQLCVVAALVNEQSWWRHVAEQSCIGRKCICWNRDWEHGSRIPSKGDNESRSPLGILRRLRDRARLTTLCRMERAISVGMLSAATWRMRNKLAQPEGLIFLTLQEESVHSLMSEP